jgi:hypothetical protein
LNRNISNVFLLFSQNAQNPGLGQTLIPQNVGKDMRKLLLGMLAGNVDDRMTAKQAMELIFNEMLMRSALFQTNMLSWIL